MWVEAGGGEFGDDLARREAEFGIAAFFEGPLGGASGVARVDEVVNLHGGGAHVFEEAGHDLVFVSVDGDETVGAGELVGEVAPGEGEEASASQRSGDGGEEMADGIEIGEVGEGVTHADGDGGGAGCDELAEFEHVGIVGFDVGVRRVGAERSFEFGEEPGAGIDGEDGREAELGEGEGLESGAGAEVDGEAARGVFEEGLENGALFGYFFVEGPNIQE